MWADKIAAATNIGFCNIGAGRCNLHHQQHGCSCSGRTSNGGLLVVILYICFSIGSGSGLDVFSNPPTLQSPIGCLQALKLRSIVSPFDINTTFITIFGYSLSYVEFIATFFGLISIWLAAKQVIWTWSTGLINIAASFIIFYQVHLYSDMFLQVFFFITNFYGWTTWKNQFQENKSVKALSTKARVLLSVLIISSTIVFGVLIKNIHLFFPKIFIHPAAFPFTDTFISVASIVGTILLAKRIIDNWTLWLIVDIVGVFLYAYKNIMFISLEYAVFCLLACLGLFSWLKSIRNDRVQITRQFL